MEDNFKDRKKETFVEVKEEVIKTNKQDDLTHITAKQFFIKIFVSESGISSKRISGMLG